MLACFCNESGKLQINCVFHCADLFLRWSLIIFLEYWLTFGFWYFACWDVVGSVLLGIRGMWQQLMLWHYIHIVPFLWVRYEKTYLLEKFQWTVCPHSTWIVGWKLWWNTCWSVVTWSVTTHKGIFLYAVCHIKGGNHPLTDSCCHTAQ